MKISRSSWHYKLQDLVFAHDCPASNLCSYFWRIVSSVPIILTVTTIVAILVLTSLPTIIVGGAFYWMIQRRRKKQEGFPRGFWFVFCAINILTLATILSVGSSVAVSIAIVNLLGAFTIGGVINDEREYMIDDQVYKPKKPNLLDSWLKAKKQKVCPLIEYVN